MNTPANDIYQTCFIIIVVVVVVIIIIGALETLAKCNKKAVLSQGNRAMQKLLVEV